MHRVELAGRGLLGPEIKTEGYEDLSDRLEKMKSVVANLQSQVKQLTNRMGDFIEARPPERPPMIIRPPSLLSELVSGDRLEEEGVEVCDREEEGQVRSRSSVVSGEEEVRSVSPEVVSEARSPSVGSQMSRSCSSEWERKSSVRMGYDDGSEDDDDDDDDDDDSDEESLGSPSRPQTPSQSIVESPTCRSSPSSFDSPRVPSLYQPDDDSDEESVSSGMEDCLGGIPWKKAPARMLEIVSLLKEGKLPEGTVLGHDDSPPNPEAPLPPPTLVKPVRPWEGKVKLGLQESGIMNGGDRRYFTHDVSPFSVCDSAAPGYSGSHAGSVVFGSGSRAGSMASVEGRDMSPCVQTKPFRVHADRPSNGEVFVFGKEDV